ncbi:hypothetical protein [Paraburkholderia fungorum]|uniref:hypothetical protein n=1 Tax=Paraburkholderia fungorum TaxID=134537 RepID=UPI0038BB7D92
MVLVPGPHILNGAIDLARTRITLDVARLPFAAVGFSAVVSMMPGFFLFRAASTLLEPVAFGPRASADLVPAVVANSATAFLILLAMTVGLILPRMLFERFATARSAP